MKTWMAVLFSLGLLAACIVVLLVTGFDITWIMVLLTALWAAIDSAVIQLRRYKTGLPSSPIVLFAACALLWIVGFPWYLAVRYKIKHGTAVLKGEYAEPIAPPQPPPDDSESDAER